MRKFEKVQIIKNVGSSWFSLGINVLVGLFLSPFILHRLGDVQFGIWVLIFSLTGYYGIFDLGIRSSIVRYISKFTATQDTEEVAKLINTGLFSYICIGVMSMLITIVACAYVNTLFHIPRELLPTATWLLFMVGTSVALGFPLGVFGGVLEGLQRFYLLNLTNVISTLVRALLIVIFLARGYGLLTVAFITVVLPLLTSAVRVAIALYILPIPFSSRYIDRQTFREMANYSGLTFMIIVASRLRFKTDAMVIGTLLSSAAITFFSIGSRLVDYAGEVVTSLAQIFVPMSSQSDATGNTDRLRKIFIAGNRVCAFTIFPISALLVIMGKSIIEIWVGTRYVTQSYPVLLILIIPWTMLLAQAASGRILFGIGKHGTLAIVTLIEGVSNLVLSILLVRPYGIIGDALGTAIPLGCTALFFLPPHLCGLLGIPMRTFLWKTYFLPLVACSPFVAILLLMQRWFPAHNYSRLSIELLAGGLVYAICLIWAFRRNRALHVGDLAPREKKSALQGTAPPSEAYQENA